MVTTKVNLKEFLETGKIKGIDFYDKPKSFLLQHLSNPKDIEEYKDVSLCYFYYDEVRFLLGDDKVKNISLIPNDDINSIFFEYRSLVKLIIFLCENKLNVELDTNRSDNDYLFIRVNNNAQVIINLQEDEIIQINYPYI